MIKEIKEYINNNLKDIVILFSCLVCGLVVGIIIYQCLDGGTKDELTKTIKATLDITKNGNFESINIIKNGVISNCIIVAIIYISAITLIAPAMIYTINVFKGFIIGIYIPTLFQTFSPLNAILIMILIIVLPNIIYIPSFIYICINSLKLNIDILNNEEKKSRISILLKNIYKFIIGFSVMILSVVIEQFLSIAVISIYKHI